MTDIRPRRSVLYMPGSNARALEKAKTLPVDTVIFDLEDAVAPEQKESAREQVIAAVKAGGYGPREVVVRMNPLSAPWGIGDLEAIATSGADAILVPKAETVDDVMAIGRVLSRLGAPTELAIWLMMETPRAVLNAGDIAEAVEEDAGRRLDALVIGTNDLAKETRTRIVPGRATMMPWLMTFVAAARANDLAIIDGVFNDLDDADGFAAECRQGRDLGMDGKTLIHPKQIEEANRAFAPSEEEIEEARAVIAAFEAPENAGKGAISLNGRMVERLHAEIAEKTVALADAIAARGGA
ncbi:HpcH/HpaI aldolase/citrate lyase family protein [Amorphus orientalis]|uniref:Citrate lyase subunit beta/citryl-CoA lyase n=1 Tax=Amorphus orientalis TaxID=649198 RepID=A0AAE3VM96_9HYPH|nr:CoA ester lyase [Amorphus orientalis]MDQ0314663.1 citrate lyase subunit beta/citryl-CoA lyase [Amorphus orientalis]